MKLRRADIILITVLLLFRAGLFGVLRLTRTPGIVAVVTVNGLETGRYSLTENQTIRIESEGGVNVLKIYDGRAEMTEADCPDKICVRTHSAKNEGDTIICLPHRVAVCIEGGESSGVDIG